MPRDHSTSDRLTTPRVGVVFTCCHRLLRSLSHVHVSHSSMYHVPTDTAPQAQHVPSVNRMHGARRMDKWRGALKPAGVLCACACVEIDLSGYVLQHLSSQFKITCSMT